MSFVRYKERKGHHLEIPTVTFSKKKLLFNAVARDQVVKDAAFADLFWDAETKRIAILFREKRGDPYSIKVSHYANQGRKLAARLHVANFLNFIGLPALSSGRATHPLSLHIERSTGTASFSVAEFFPNGTQEASR